MYFICFIKDHNYTEQYRNEWLVARTGSYIVHSKFIPFYPSLHPLSFEASSLVPLNPLLLVRVGWSPLFTEVSLVRSEVN